MAIQYSATHRTNNMQDLVTIASTVAYLLIYTGSAANCAAAPSGTLLVSLPCNNPLGTVLTGQLTINVTGMSAATGNPGTAAQWRLCTTSAGTTCFAQGTVNTTGGDLNFAGGIVWTAGETITVTSFTITATGL